jgi:hypothetical protein
MKGRYLITTDAWFYAPDGKKYRSAWGNVEILEDSFLGLKTNRNSTNWYAFIGSEERGMMVAGCQIHYAVKCLNPPNGMDIDDVSYSDAGMTKFKRPSEIYFAE